MPPMPTLTPSMAPPLPDRSNSTTASKLSPKMNSHPSQPVSQIEPPSIGTLAPRIPRIRLDMDAIPDMMAAKLATSLLGHVLFLKNQVPL